MLQENILLNVNMDIRLTDFGLASKITNEAKAGFTNEPHLLTHCGMYFIKNMHQPANKMKL